MQIGLGNVFKKINNSAGEKKMLLTLFPQLLTN